MIATAMSPGEQLRQWRESIGLDQEDVAQALNVKQQTVSNWERGDWAKGDGPHRKRAEELDRVLHLREGSALYLILTREPPTDHALDHQDGWRQGQTYGQAFARGQLDAVTTQVKELSEKVEELTRRIAALPGIAEDERPAP